MLHDPHRAVLITYPPYAELAQHNIAHLVQGLGVDLHTHVAGARPDRLACASVPALLSCRHGLHAKGLHRAGNLRQLLRGQVLADRNTEQMPIDLIGEHIPIGSAKVAVCLELGQRNGIMDAGLHAFVFQKGGQRFASRRAHDK